MTPRRIRSPIRGGLACLRINDSGLGMGPEVLAHIFEPFFTTKDVGLGTGLGLASVYGIVHQHQGWIEVESAVGRAPRFACIYPVRRSRWEESRLRRKRRRANAERKRSCSSRTRSRCGNSPRLMLERLGYRVLAATDGQVRCSSGGTRRQFDLLLTDMVMPNGMTGNSIGDSCSSNPNLSSKIVVMSGYSEDMLGVSSRSGVKKITFLAKPFPAEVIAGDHSPMPRRETGPAGS